jgi:hypothetical protein
VHGNRRASAAWDFAGVRALAVIVLLASPQACTDCPRPLIVHPAYVARAIAVDRGYFIPALQPRRCEQPEVSNAPYTPPPTVAQADDGTVAFVETALPPRCDSSRIVLIRADGKRTILRLPAIAYVPAGSQVAAASTLCLDPDGNPSVTVSSHFSGAYSGTRKAAFTWRKGAWQQIRANLPQRYDGPRNVTVAAATADARFGVYGDYDDANRFEYAVFSRDPTYYTPEAAIISGGRTVSVGFGSITSMAGRYTSGYLTQYQHNGIPHTLFWDGLRQYRLGTGVGFGVNLRGDVVGDDRGAWAQPGFPTIWHGGRARRLSSQAGSAFAARGDTIVGAIASTGFVADASDRRHVYRLDTLLHSPWRVVSAFAIAKDGQILAVGELKNGTPTILILLRSKDH